MLHTSVAPDDRWSQTTDCLEVAAAFPQVRFAMAQWMRFHAPSLKLAAQLDNVWVDCSTLLLHCELAVQDSPVVAARRDRVDADFDNPAEVVEVVHGLLGGKYVRGSDNPYQSWSDDLFTSIHTYAERGRRARRAAGRRTRGDAADRAGELARCTRVMIRASRPPPVDSAGRAGARCPRPCPG